jgi:hypothetical protein
MVRRFLNAGQPRSVRGACLGFNRRKSFTVLSPFFLILPADDPHLADCIQLVMSRSVFMFLTNASSSRQSPIKNLRGIHVTVLHQDLLGLRPRSVGDLLPVHLNHESRRPKTGLKRVSFRRLLLQPTAGPRPILTGALARSIIVMQAKVALLKLLGQFHRPVLVVLPD